MPYKIVSVESCCVVDDEGCERNLRSVLARNLSWCKPGLERAERLAIVASGPSVADFLDDISAHDQIWAVNGAYDYLLGRGIAVNGFFGSDPLPGLAAYVRNVRTTAYLSAYCDPSVFDAVSGDVQVWLPARWKEDIGDDVDLESDLSGLVRVPEGLPEGVGHIQGGTTALTRAPFLAQYLGFRDITLFGADSSFNGRRYVYEDGTYPDDSQSKIMPVMVNGEGPFFTEGPLLHQVSQLGLIAHYQTWGARLSIRCHGLMDAYLRAPMEYDADDV